MTDSDGQLVNLDALLARGPLVISFNRGPWCDYCGLELQALARAYPDIVASGGEVVSVVPETAKYASGLRRGRNLPFRVLTDLDLAYALSLVSCSGSATRSRTRIGSSGSISSSFRAIGGGCCRSPPHS
jgi:peroxiredoxin